ncbi:MAG: hypothetical protein CM15mP102_02350 [Flavobacteriales bacterium]|nr:MAG: hypothetical protein CM15mP102_02350 [Flavobacteriales bacterium]
MSNVATSFSDFATLPKTQLEKTDIVDATKRLLKFLSKIISLLRLQVKTYLLN